MSGAGEVLGRRALGRALLARQMLLARVEMPALDAVERLVGMQAQVPTSPYVGLWARLEGFRPEELSRRVEDRSVVRIALMRSTIHLVTARDSLFLRPLVQPVLDRGYQGAYRKRLGDVDRAAVAAAARTLLEERPLTFRDLGALLAERFPHPDPDALAQLARTLLPLVQVPPRGVWGRGGPAAHTTVESWLGRPLDPDPSPDAMVLRYLAAFGPATVSDAQAWSGLTRLRDAFERLRPNLATFRDEHGAELFDLPDAPRPDADTPAPVRFLADYDNLILSHADRTRVISDEHRRRIFTGNGLLSVFLVDGVVAGSYRIEREKRTAALLVQPMVPLSAEARDALAEEGARLLAFTAEDAETREVRFTAGP